MSSTQILGYLSIHQSALGTDDGLWLKWVPNRAMSTDAGQEQQTQQPLKKTLSADVTRPLHALDNRRARPNSARKVIRDEEGEVDSEPPIRISQGS